MTKREVLDTHQKALQINLDPSKYGTFAEIGAGQEVALEDVLELAELLAGPLERLVLGNVLDARDFGERADVAECGADVIIVSRSAYARA